ncbi:uncharacterized protein METZ01_LOCUS492082, partial [marine metagenome]
PGAECDMAILPYKERTCSFEGKLPALTAPGQTMSYTVTFQDVGFKTDNGLEHPVSGDDTACMPRAEFDALVGSDPSNQEFDPDVPADALAALPDDDEPVCGGPNQVTLGPYTYTLKDPANALATSSMMNIGISGITDGPQEGADGELIPGNTYDVHVTYFEDVNEYVVEYDGTCDAAGALRYNMWLEFDNQILGGASGDNLDHDTPCGMNVAYAYDSVTNSWMSSRLTSEGIDYFHN